MSTFLEEHISDIPLFSGIDHETLFATLEHCKIIQFKPAQHIYRYGEYGDDCGVILTGSAHVELPAKGTEKTEHKIILHPGDIFGEIAVLSGYTRTADVTALQPTKILVLSRDTLLKLLKKFPTFKQEIDRLYRERVLSTQLLTIPILAGVPPELINGLIGKASLLHFRSGDVVFRQGEEADTFYLVRYGFLKVSEIMSNKKERILAYLKGGHYFGEIALIKENEKRMATVTAIDPTELIGVAREDFLDIMKSHPRIRTGLEKAIERTQERNAKIRADECMARTLSAVIDSGVLQARGMLVIDTTKCIQCDNCVKACSALHNNQSLLVRKGAKLNNILLIPTSCRNCDNPTCMMNCPTGTITRDSSGEIYHRDTCIGCGNCARNCPYGNITIISLSETNKKNNLLQRYFTGFFNNRETLNEQYDSGNDETEKPVRKAKKLSKKALKCDMCRDHPFLGCVYNCPRGAARRIDPTEFFGDITIIT
jgi:CRP-like cAMP-binding protein/Fe-S-cluster-containing hydrogenase component 2